MEGARDLLQRDFFPSLRSRTATSRFPGAFRTEGDPETKQHTLVYLRLMWAHRGMLYRVSLYALLFSSLIAFLIPRRYETTSDLGPRITNPRPVS